MCSLSLNCVWVQDDPKLPDDNAKAPKLNGVVSNLISGRKIISLLDGNQSGGQMPRVFYFFF